VGGWPPTSGRAGDDSDGHWLWLDQVGIRITYDKCKVLVCVYLYIWSLFLRIPTSNHSQGTEEERST
jgi:hypothetical protein